MKRNKTFLEQAHTVGFFLITRRRIWTAGANWRWQWGRRIAVDANTKIPTDWHSIWFFGPFQFERILLVDRDEHGDSLGSYS